MDNIQSETLEHQDLPHASNEPYPLDEGAAAGLLPSLLDSFALMTEKEFCLLVGISSFTLKMWRSNKQGPSYVRLGRRIFYRREDVRKWINASVITHLL